MANEDREARAQRRREAERAAARKEKRKKVVTYALAGILGVAALVGIVLAIANSSDGGEESGDPTDPRKPSPALAGAPTISYGDSPQIPQPREFDMKKAAEAAGCKLEDTEPASAEHRPNETISYDKNPPVAGDHDPVWTEDGIFTQAPRTENSVHALEHGRIAIQFKPDLPQQRIDQLRALYEEDTYHTQLYPNGTKMTFEVAATTWGHALLCERFTDGAFDAIRTFKDEWRDKGPEFVP